MQDGPGFFSTMFAPSSFAFQLKRDSESLTLWYHFPLYRISLHPFGFQQPNIMQTYYHIPTDVVTVC